MTVVLAIDPGRDKCGVAVVGPEGVLYKEVTPAETIGRRVADLVAASSPSVIIVGAGTTGRNLADALRANMPHIPVELVDEKNSTLRARVRFFRDNPPGGLLRLIPRGMLVPNRPYDDYAAIILAEDYLTRNS
jgi:RNase H-fold protein (predicted Holliday junction resolvase)